MLKFIFIFIMLCGEIQILSNCSARKLVALNASMYSVYLSMIPLRCVPRFSVFVLLGICHDSSNIIGYFEEGVHKF